MHLKKAFGLDKNVNNKFAEEFLRNLKPDFIYERDQMVPTAVLEFSILKIINAVARRGKDLKEIYSSWDVDKNGYCKPWFFNSHWYLVDASEIMRGVTVGLGISLSREESHLLTAYLDKDGDARVSYQEFATKINFKNY